MPRRAGLLPAQGGPGGFPEDNGVMQTGREQLMGCRCGCNQCKGRGKEFAPLLGEAPSWGRAGIKQEGAEWRTKSFGGFRQGPGSRERWF